MVAEALKDLLQKQHYKIVGRHSAVKLCLWLKKSLKGEGVCYKEEFYGIKSHRCLQFTPSVEHCNHQCVYCWRNTQYTNSKPMLNFDEPEFIVDEAIKKQKMLLTGFGGILDRIDEKKYLEAHHPNQAAISLAGEPTFYPKLSELLDIFHSRKFTTFLVSNGTNPSVLENLDSLPSQLYISLDAPSKDMYERICNPVGRGGWEKLNTSLEVLNHLDTKTVTRLTLVEGVNISDSVGYSNLINKAEPDYIEVKAFMLVGGARDRLNLDNMPTHQKVVDFSKKISDLTGYKITNEREDSRVVLLSKK